MSDFHDVGRFHARFGLEHVNPEGEERVPFMATEAIRRFRLNFMQEELNEFESASNKDDLAGMADALVDIVYVALGTAHMMLLPWEALFREVQRANMTKERSGLDHPFEPPSESSSRAGMDWCARSYGGPHVVGTIAQEVLPGAFCGQPAVKHSRRGSALDVIKPAGWTPPDIEGVLMRAGWVPPALRYSCPSCPAPEVKTCPHCDTGQAFKDSTNRYHIIDVPGERYTYAECMRS